MGPKTKAPVLAQNARASWQMYWSRVLWIPHDVTARSACAKMVMLLVVERIVVACIPIMAGKMVNDLQSKIDSGEFLLVPRPSFILTLDKALYPGA